MLTPETYEITVNTLSSIDDHRLAIEICKALSALTNSTIRGEESEAMTIQDFEQNYNDKWIEENAHQGIGALKHMVSNQGSEVRIPGINIEYCIGKRLFVNIEADRLTNEELYLKLVQGMLNLHALKDQGYWIPTLFEANGLEGPWTYTVLSLKEKQLVKYADYVMMSANDQEYLRVRFEHLSKLIGHSKFRLADNSQLVCEALTAEEAASVISMMRPLSEVERKNKPWWKFWS